MIHGNLHNVLNHLIHGNLHSVLIQVTRTNRSGFRRRCRSILLQPLGTILAQAPISIFSVAFLPPPHHQLDVFLQQFVVASSQDHQVLEEALRTLVAIPSVNCCCAGQAQSVPVLRDHCRQHCRQVFLGNQVQASKHRAIVLAQVRPNSVFVLEIEMAVEAIQVHHSHDPSLDRNFGILAQPPRPDAHALRDM